MTPSLALALILPLLVACAAAPPKSAPDAARALSRSIVPVAIVAWPDADRRPGCRLHDPPQPPDFAGFVEPGDATRYYITMRQLHDAIDWYKELRDWTAEVTACVRRLTRDE
jgi:hypothetical protein